MWQMQDNLTRQWPYIWRQISIHFSFTYSIFGKVPKRQKMQRSDVDFILSEKWLSLSIAFQIKTIQSSTKQLIMFTVFVPSVAIGYIAHTFTL